MASQASLNIVQQLYVAYYGRPADSAGLQYWADRLEAEGEGAIINAFGTSAEYDALSEGQDHAALVNNLYVQMFSREAEAEGLEFWVGVLESGEKSLAEIALTIKNAARGTDVQVLATKVEVATQYTVENGDIYDIDVAKQIVVDVNIDNIVIEAPGSSSEDSSSEDSSSEDSSSEDSSSEDSSSEDSSSEDSSSEDSSVENGDDAPAAETYKLTASVDEATANVFNAKPEYTPGGNDLVNTLQNEDELTGTGENPTLNVTLSNANDAAQEGVVTPILNGIETVNVQVTGNANGINFQDATDLEALNVTRILETNAKVAFEDLDKTTTELSLSNATREGEVTFDYREDTLTANNDALSLTLDGVRLNSLAISEGGDSNEDQGYGFETVDVTVDGTTDLDSLSIAENVREDARNETEQTVNVVANAKLEINDLQADGAESLSIEANADVMIAADEDDVLKASNDGISTAELQSLTVTGEGNVTIDGLGGDVKAFADENGLSVAASAMTGDLTLGVEADTAADDLFSVESGSGNDEIATYGALGGDVVTNEGDDAVSVIDASDIAEAKATLDALDAAPRWEVDAAKVDEAKKALAAAEAAETVFAAVEGTASIATGAGNDTVTAGDLNAAADDYEAGNSSFGEVEAARITTGEGDDTVTVGALKSEQDWNHGVLSDVNVDDTYLMAGASVDTGAGNDRVTLTTVAEGATVSTGEGDDTLTVENVSGTVLAADNADDSAEVNAEGEEDLLGAVVELGAGNDTASFSQNNTIAGEFAATLVGRDAELRAGEGNDVLNVTALDAVTVATKTVAETKDTNATISGVETANFTVANQVDADSAFDTGAEQNDAGEEDGAITADVMRFDESLSEINLVSEEQAMLEDTRYERYQSGTATEFTLNNLREDIAVNLNAQEASGVTDGALKDDEITDVTLTVDMAEARAHDDTFTLNVGEGSSAFDLSLKTVATSTDLVGDAASSTDDDDQLIENVVINLEDAQSHAIDLNGFGDSQFVNSEPNIAAQKQDEGQGKEAVTSLTINGTAEGSTLNVTNVNADTIAIAGAADVNLSVDAENNYAVTTGSGDDILNMVDDLVDEEDAIDAGEGRNTLVISGDNDLGSSTPEQRENDDVWANKANIQVLDVVASGDENQIVLDEEALATGIDTVNVTGSGPQELDLVLGDDFKRDLTIDTARAGQTSLSLTNRVDDADSIIDVALTADEGAVFTLNDQYDRATANLDITVDDVLTSIGSDVDGKTSGGVDLNVESGQIDTITLTDNNSVGDDGKVIDNGHILLAVASNWSKTALTIDASAIANDDYVAGKDEDNDGTNTGSLFLDAFAETDAELTISGTQNDDAIIGGRMGDTISGNDGDDYVYGLDGVDTLDGGNGNDTIAGDAGDDVIDGGAGDDTIAGGAGAETLTGGAGQDTFVYASADESSGTSMDVITDFVAGTVDNNETPEVLTDDTTDGDLFDFSGLLASVNKPFQVVSFLGNFANSTVADTALGNDTDAGALTVVFVENESTLYADMDRSGDINTGDLAIELTGISGELTQANFNVLV